MSCPCDRCSGRPDNPTVSRIPAPSLDVGPKTRDAVDRMEVRDGRLPRIWKATGPNRWTVDALAEQRRAEA